MNRMAKGSKAWRANVRSCFRVLVLRYILLLLPWDCVPSLLAYGHCKVARSCHTLVFHSQVGKADIGAHFLQRRLDQKTSQIYIKQSFQSSLRRLLHDLSVCSAGVSLISTNFEVFPFSRLRFDKAKRELAGMARSISFTVTCSFPNTTSLEDSMQRSLVLRDFWSLRPSYKLSWPHGGLPTAAWRSRQ